MNTTTKYQITEKNITNDDGECALLYGIKAETEETSCTIYDISCDLKEIKTYINLLERMDISPAELYKTIESFIDSV